MLVLAKIARLVASARPPARAARGHAAAAPPSSVMNSRRVIRSPRRRGRATRIRFDRQIGGLRFLLLTPYLFRGVAGLDHDRRRHARVQRAEIFVSAGLREGEREA